MVSVGHCGEKMLSLSPIYHTHTHSHTHTHTHKHTDAHRGEVINGGFGLVLDGTEVMGTVTTCHVTIR